MESVDFVRAAMALAIVIGLLLLCAAGLRLWGGRFGLSMPQKNLANRKIQMLEATLLDSRHRLVRVRVDKREHLILLGGASPVVVESKDAEESE